MGENEVSNRTNICSADVRKIHPSQSEGRLQGERRIFRRPRSPDFRFPRPARCRFLRQVAPLMKKGESIPRTGTGAANRTDPLVPPAAREIEREMVSILGRLLKHPSPSCLDKEFVVGYKRVLSLFSSYQGAVLAAYPLPVTCTKGCGVCCNHWPEDTYSFEVLSIAYALRRTRSRDIGPIRAALREDIDSLADLKRIVGKKFDDPAPRGEYGDIDPYDLVLSSFYQLNRPCPLLGADGSCSIYAIRPLTCRVYISFSSPALCAPDAILGEEAMTYLLDLEKDTSDLFDSLHFAYDIFDGDTSLRSMLFKALGE